ncbi:MAG: hypothetical protein J0I48_15435 [Devosia sp.]|uniref:hypothetical protein n=1 Tax=Devosia sp. 66-22 TaxID=1895753 RepID=UPI0009274487|nr:hypothetical protein [Devosia sp. 66-22]MBN9347563.1 hypothetical protein [Devosia sp.]OJX50678.1 MAG: hypothetical protein BGO81_20735 [Devosia sp. 66-22]
MAALSVTAANVKKGAGAQAKEGVAGATITAGQAVILSAGKYVLADCDATDLKGCDGIALHAASDGQPLDIQSGGEINLGATLVAGTTYYLAPTAGGIGPVEDVASGDDPIIIGIAKSATTLMMRITDPNVTI